jgi:iron(III) transport system ATP-binding protein
MSRVLLQQIEKRYEAFHAVRALDMEIAEGELVTFLGPSGCGKTTTLRMVAGLETPTAGRILLGDRVVNDPAAGVFIPPEKRRIGMVFQSYAVWPHMNVARNIDYPLRIQKTPREEREARLREILALVQLTGQEHKWPHQLSGGQQQRVALARGLIMKPAVLLMDEPLSNLDAKLRRSMRSEIRDIQRELGMTMLYVTHDREEAEAISDRMAVMFAGRLAQVGPPAEIRDNPAGDEVRQFFTDD